MQTKQKRERQQEEIEGQESSDLQQFPDEVRHLQDISGKLDTAYRAAEESLGQIDREYMETKRYMMENRAEIDPREMFQGEQLLRQIDTTVAIAAQSMERLERLKDSPYFARIDFRAQEQPEPATYYIGRFSFTHEKKIIIFDWRAPVSSMFYDCELGPAGYTAPRGQIDGELTKKRQFKIKDGIMEYALESSLNVQDDVLQKELSHTSDEKMKSIISTIQKEQNQIIRNGNTKTLVIQGVAGSGKTSIALHRVAFLLYRYKKQLAAQNIMILSPNKVFGSYIANVLPELGEEPIYEFSFTDIADTQLDRIIGFEEERNPLETFDEEWARRVQFKSTLAFVELMDEYIEQLPQRVFEPVDYVFPPFTAKAEWIQARFDAYERYSIVKRLQMVADDMLDRFETDNIREEPLPKMRNIIKQLKGMLKYKKTYQLYRDFYKEIGCPKMLMLAEKNTLEWNDVFPFLYLHAAFEGVEISRRIRHLLIDEMQDYTPIQYAVVNKLFPCPKTILGDFGQSIHPYHANKLEDLAVLYEDAQLVQLNKSYRSTYEIISFAKRIQFVSQLEAVERHGDKPQVICFGNEGEKLDHMRSMIREFAASGYASMGIITKTNAAAQALYQDLQGEGDIYLISPSSDDFKNGVSITSVQMSKGLEFDQVVIPDADDASYHSEYERGLMYVACTRAMHRLALLYSGEKSRLLP